MREKLLTVWQAMATAMTVLTGAIALPLLIRPFYYLHIAPLGLSERTGLSVEEIKACYRDVMDYCLGLRADFACGVLPFSESGASHFADVRFLFLLNMAILAVGIVSLLAIALLRRRGLVPCRPLGRGGAWWGCVGLGVTAVAVGLLAATDFDRAFTVFHTIFFPGKDNWIFDWRVDPVIVLLPQVFFRNCALLILTAALGGCAAILLTDGKHRNRG